MHPKVRAFALAGALACAVMSGARAQDAGEQLVTEFRCNACHLMSEPMLGPPYVAIAARHAAESDVMIDVLARKIVHGGGGNWGIVPMVPNQWVSMEQAREMARWILGLRPADQ